MVEENHHGQGRGGVGDRETIRDTAIVVTSGKDRFKLIGQVQSGLRNTFK